MNLTQYIDSRRDGKPHQPLRIFAHSKASARNPSTSRTSSAPRNGWPAKLRAAGLDNVEILPTNMHPLVYGEVPARAPGKPTILFYGHYDVQPAEPLNLWTSLAFEPTVRGGNLFARGSADDKRPGAYPHVARSTRS